MRLQLTSKEIDTVYAVFDGLLKTHKSTELQEFLDPTTIRDMAILFGKISLSKFEMPTLGK